MSSDLENKVAVITGAGRGIGKTVIQHFQLTVNGLRGQKM